MTQLINPRLQEQLEQMPIRATHEALFSILRRFAGRRWRLFLWGSALNFFAAFFDGTTMAILGIAISFLTLRDVSVLGEEMGFLSAVVTSLDETSFFLLLIGLAVLSQALRHGLQYGGSLVIASLRWHIQAQVKHQVFRLYLSLTHAEINQYRLGDLSAQLLYASIVSNYALQLGQLVANILTITVYGVLLLVLSPSLTLISLFFFGVLGLIVRFIAQRIQKLASQAFEQRRALLDDITEYLQALHVLRVFAQEERVLAESDALIEQERRYLLQGTRWQDGLKPFIQVGGILVIALFLVLGFFTFEQDAAHTALPALITFSLILWRVVPIIDQLSMNFGTLKNNEPYVRHIAATLNTANKATIRDGTRHFTSFKDAIVFDNVSLQYVVGERPAVKHLSLTIERGQMTAFVGESGAGKSSIIALLTRLYEASEGEIRVDGIPLNDLTLKSWRQRIAVVDQNPFTFHRSVYENIRFGNPEASHEDVIDAARRAQAHDFIMELDHGYDTVIGERGFRLSGGQRQRLALARALVREADILILDEATSNLDSESERLIQQALDDIRGEHTLIVVAHRLSTIYHADQIVVLQRGEVVEKGTHAALSQREGPYARFWALQSQNTHRDP